MRPLSRNAALIIIDVQKGFDHPYWGRRNNPAAEERMAQVLAAFRESKRPVFHVQHMSVRPESPLFPGSPGNDLKAEVQPLPGELVIRKTVNSAFIGTRLEAELREKGIETVVIMGITTNHCVSTSARMAGNLGFETYVLADACATFDKKSPSGRSIPSEVMHEVGLTELHDEFAQVIESEALLRAL